MVALFSGELEPAPERIWEQITGTLGIPAGQTLPDNVVPFKRERRTISVKAFTWTAGVAAAVVVAIGTMAITRALFYVDFVLLNNSVNKGWSA